MVEVFGDSNLFDRQEEAAATAPADTHRVPPLWADNVRFAPAAGSRRRGVRPP
jgi:hypothetical protein